MNASYHRHPASCIKKNFPGLVFVNSRSNDRNQHDSQSRCLAGIDGFLFDLQQRTAP